MTRQDELSPTETPLPSPTGPETTSPNDDTRPAPSPLPAAPPTPEAATPPSPGSLVLQTTLLGPLTVPDGAAHAAELEELSRRAYRSAWRQYAAWCASLGREPLAGDPDTVAMYRCADQGSAGRRATNPLHVT